MNTNTPKTPPSHAQTDTDAGLYWLPREYPNHPADSLTPARAAVLLRDADRGQLQALAQLADDMEERDTHLYAELSKRRRACLHVPWSLVLDNPSKSEQAALDTLYALLEQLELPALLFDLSDAIHKGYACIEMAWAHTDGAWLPTTLIHRPAHWFMTHQDQRHQLRLRDLAGTGTPLTPYNWIQHRHPARSGYPGETSLARVTVWPFLFRQNGGRDFAEFLEIYGLPGLLGRYDTQASDKDKSRLMTAVQNVGRMARGILPLGMQIEVLEATKGDADPFAIMLKWAEDSLSKAILGGTLTSSVDGKGSYAASQTHDGVRKELRDTDLLLLASTLTRDLITPLTRFNTPLTRIPTFRFEVREPEDISQYADALPKLAGLMPIPLWWVQEKLNIPAAQAGEECLSTPQAPTQADKPDESSAEPNQDKPDKQAAATHTGCPHCESTQVKLNSTQPAGHTADSLDADFLNHTPAQGQEQVQALLAPILSKAKALLKAGTSPEQAWLELLEAYPLIDSSLLEQTLARSVLVAELAGQWDMQQVLAHGNTA